MSVLYSIQSVAESHNKLHLRSTWHAPHSRPPPITSRTLRSRATRRSLSPSFSLPPSQYDGSSYIFASEGVFVALGDTHTFDPPLFSVVSPSQLMLAEYSSLTAFPHLDWQVLPVRCSSVYLHPNCTFVSIPHRLSPPLPVIPPDAYAQFRSFPKIIPSGIPRTARIVLHFQLRLDSHATTIYGGDDIHQYLSAPPSRMPYPSHSRHYHGLTIGATLAGLRVPHMNVFHGSACFQIWCVHRLFVADSLSWSSHRCVLSGFPTVFYRVSDLGPRPFKVVYHSSRWDSRSLLTLLHASTALTFRARSWSHVTFTAHGTEMSIKLLAQVLAALVSYWLIGPGGGGAHHQGQLWSYHGTQKCSELSLIHQIHCSLWMLGRNSSSASPMRRLFDCQILGGTTNLTTNPSHSISAKSPSSRSRG